MKIRNCITTNALKTQGYLVERNPKETFTILFELKAKH